MDQATYENKSHSVGKYLVVDIFTGIKILNKQKKITIKFNKCKIIICESSIYKLLAVN